MLEVYGPLENMSEFDWHVTVFESKDSLSRILFCCLESEKRKGVGFYDTCS